MPWRTLYQIPFSSPKAAGMRTSPGVEPPQPPCSTVDFHVQPVRGRHRERPRALPHHTRYSIASAVRPTLAISIRSWDL